MAATDREQSNMRRVSAVFGSGTRRPLSRAFAGRVGVCTLVALAPASAAWTPDGALASEAAYRRFVDSFWQTARKRGISRELYVKAFEGLTPDPVVVRKNAHQPEFVLTASQYLSLTVSDTRIEKGRRKLEELAPVLDRIERRWGVDRHVLLAIWGMETNFGLFKGSMNVFRSLSTLGYRGRRTRFGRRELLAALKIVQRGEAPLEKMVGSWAGAMGHTQLIPSNYTAHAVDFDGDGKRDIWDTVPDALASAANLLKSAKWRAGQTWGYEVTLPGRFDTRLVGRRNARSLARWRALGVRRVRGQAFPRPGDRASLFLPAGRRGPAFLLLGNFRSIMGYNAATKYALAVGHLADRLRGAPAFARPWPDGVRPLTKDERLELQRLLAAGGYDVGEVDGILGSKTRAAIKAFQKKKRLRADGFPHPKILALLRAEGGGTVSPPESPNRKPAATPPIPKPKP